MPENLAPFFSPLSTVDRKRTRRGEGAQGTGEGRSGEGNMAARPRKKLKPYRVGDLPSELRPVLSLEKNRRACEVAPGLKGRGSEFFLGERENGRKRPLSGKGLSREQVPTLADLYLSRDLKVGGRLTLTSLGLWSVAGFPPDPSRQTGRLR